MRSSTVQTLSRIPHRVLFALSLTLIITISPGQDVSDPWSKADLLDPAVLAQVLQSGKPPVILCVAFPVLYRTKHILHAIDAGTGSKPEGIESLKRAVARFSKDSDIVVYCGCCPMTRCPNIRPAYRTLKELGYTRVRVLNIPTNMHTDWYEKNYPFEVGLATPPTSSPSPTRQP
jgi:thiosulfate/3-mercaptopyruvate sulfurtransferase